MNKIILTISIAAAFLIGFVAPAAAAPEPTSPTMCVQTKAPKNWGVKRAVNKWNATGLGPRMVIRKQCSGLTAVIKVVPNSSRTTGMTAWSNYDEATGEWSRIHISLNPRFVKRGYHRSYHACLRNYTTTHELGHALGLEHNSSQNSVMSYENWWNNCGRITDHDISSLTSIYGK